MESQITKPVKNRSTALLILLVLFLAFRAASVVMAVIDGSTDLTWFGLTALKIVVAFLMYFSYKSHTKNVMKPVIGAALMISLYFELIYSLDYLETFEQIRVWFVTNTVAGIFVGLNLAVGVAIALMNVMHYVINATHHSSPGKVLCNKIVYWVYFVLNAALCAVTYFGSALACDLLSYISAMLLIGMVVVIESSLDEYRIAREANSQE